MPEEVKKEVTGFQDPAAHNAEIAQKLAAQDIMGQNSAPKDDGSASDALDNLAKQAEEAAKKAKDESEKPKVEPVAPPAKTEADLAKEKAAAEAVEAAKKRADDLFRDSPSLPPGASPKSSESFAAIKIKAAQEVAAREAEIEKLKKEHAELQEKLKNTAPPETLKELEDHRAWRAKLDVEADPKFKEYDKNISQTQEFIYAQLQRSSVITPEVIAEIKKHGGPENVKMDKIFAAINDPALQRTVEAKIADIEQKKFEKTNAIKAAKDNITEYISSREKAATESLTKHNSDTERHLGEITKQLSWYNEKKVDEKADKAAREEAEAHNAFVNTTKSQLSAALKDDSPEMRAIMIAGMAQLFYLQKVHAGTEAKLSAAEKSLADITAKYEKLKSGSLTRLRESQADPNANPTPQKKDTFEVPAGDALDNLRKQVTEERERAAAAGR